MGAKALYAALEGGGEIAILGHDNPDMDSLLSCVLMQRLLFFWGFPSRIVLHTPADGQCRRLMPQMGFDIARWRGKTGPGDRLILVDHHEKQHEGQVVAIVDHHPTAYPPNAPYVQLEPSGACAAMVYRLMLEAGMEADADNEALAVSALYLDSVALRSTKILPQEAAWAKERACALGLDLAWLTREGLGLQDMRLPVEILAMTGKKRFQFSGRLVCSSYVQTNEMTSERLCALLDCVRTALKEEGAALWVFLHHDPDAMRSMEYDLFADGTMETIDYGRLVSRGKDIMPRVEERMRNGYGHEA